MGGPSSVDTTTHARSASAASSSSSPRNQEPPAADSLQDAPKTQQEQQQQQQDEEDEHYLQVTPNNNNNETSQTTSSKLTKKRLDPPGVSNNNQSNHNDTTTNNIIQQTQLDPTERCPRDALKKNHPAHLDAASWPDNRRHAQAVRQKTAHTSLTLQCQALQQQVQQEKELNLVLRQQMHDAWKQQCTMLNMMMRSGANVPMFPMPAVLATPPPRWITGPSERDAVTTDLAPKRLKTRKYTQRRQPKRTNGQRQPDGDFSLAKKQTKTKQKKGLKPS